jgi:hypothetical protein
MVRWKRRPSGRERITRQGDATANCAPTVAQLNSCSVGLFAFCRLRCCCCFSFLVHANDSCAGISPVRDRLLCSVHSLATYADLVPSGFSWPAHPRYVAWSDRAQSLDLSGFAKLRARGLQNGAALRSSCVRKFVLRLSFVRRIATRRSGEETPGDPNLTLPPRQKLDKRCFSRASDSSATCVLSR